ncbi:MAG TPA: fused MFS/spermidine synthase [Pirellulales bacterium]|nr:fused MFS/spermidine synthase [Pirellulales bacterium]
MLSTRWSRLAVLYASTIFVSAFLLFEVELLVSLYILPWFGGSPAVWNTCLLFFQTTLLAGYVYAHVSEHYFSPRLRTLVHLALLGAALATLPIAPSDSWKPADSDHPILRILTLLSACVGVAFFVLSSTGPLVQAWFSQTMPGRSPYRLYSLSNVGSLLALLSYPFLVEPALDGATQSLWWSIGFVLFVILCGTACWQTARLRGLAAAAPAASPEAATETAAADERPPSLARRLGWLALPAFASMLLPATTNHVCQDVASIPFLWVMPLSLYLLSFIIAFDHERWYRRLPYGLGAMTAIYLTAGMYSPGVWSAGWLGTVHQWIWGGTSGEWMASFSLPLELACEFSTLFFICMLCHGELFRLRPAPRYLTSYYLMIAAGGPVGGVFVALIAPTLFSSYVEWKLGIVGGFILAAVITFALAGRSAASGSPGPRPKFIGTLRLAGVLVALAALFEIGQLMRGDELSTRTILAQVRNFYGVLAVADENADNPTEHAHVLFHGMTNHGMQLVNAELRQTPIAYYIPESGIGQVLRYYGRQKTLRVGIVGQGAGALAVYLGGPGHTMRFYEINPEVPRLAEEYFTYLSDARERGATIELVLGDARLTLERELVEPQAFDVLALDAFSGDSIPNHLLTQEAFEIFIQHLAPGGAMIVHISNRYLDLAPVVYGLAEHFGLPAKRIFSVDAKHGGWGADFIILSHNQEMLDSLHLVEGTLPRDPPQPPFPLWTDQKHNLLEALR